MPGIPNKGKGPFQDRSPSPMPTTPLEYPAARRRNALRLARHAGIPFSDSRAESATPGWSRSGRRPPAFCESPSSHTPGAACPAICEPWRRSHTTRSSPSPFKARPSTVSINTSDIGASVSVQTKGDDDGHDRGNHAPSRASPVFAQFHHALSLRDRTLTGKWLPAGDG